MFRWQSRGVQRAPTLVLTLVVAITAGLLAGFFVQDVPPAPIEATASFLPAESELAEASKAIRESFPDFAGVEIVQILARGDVLSADSLRSVRDLLERIIGDPMVRPFIGDDPLAGHVPITERLLAAVGLDLATVSDAEVDAAVARAARVPRVSRGQRRSGASRSSRRPRDTDCGPLPGHPERGR